jgi:DNA-binding PadR family transcriptional regulator
MYWHQAYDGKEGFLSSQSIGQLFYDIPRLSWFRYDDRYRNASEYQLKRKIHNRIDVSISRTLTKLQERGLVTKAKDGHTAGCRLTTHGLQMARSLMPAHLTGPTEQEEKILKQRRIQARIEWEDMIKRQQATAGKQ